MEREKRIGGFLMESESSVGENTAAAENGGSITTPPLPEEEVISSSKRRKTHDSEVAADSKENSATSSVVVIGGKLLSEYLKSTDLKSEEIETAVSTFDTAEFSEETSLSSELSGEESVEAMDSSSMRNKESSSSRNCAAQMPSTAEIEEFFAVAEKSEQERFAKKYNYDIEKDVPLKGRYQWIPLKL